MGLIAAEHTKDYQIARNIVAQNQLSELSLLFMRHKIRFMPLKGIALLDMLYKDISERFISDIDLLVTDKDLPNIHSLMIDSGYDPVSETPSGWMPREPMNLPIDLHTDVWYLSKKEMKNLWEVSPVKIIAGNPCQTLPREEMVVYTIAHALIHHGMSEGMWRQDFKMMFRNWSISIDVLMEKLHTYNLMVSFMYAFGLVKSELPAEYRSAIQKHTSSHDASSYKMRVLKRMLATKHNLKGHLLRFLFQRNILFLFTYAFRSLFPSIYFIKRRYDINTGMEVVLAYIMRPCMFLFYAVKVIKKAFSRS